VERAVALGGQSIAMYRGARDDYGILMGLLHVAFVTLARGDYERTSVLLREGSERDCNRRGGWITRCSSTTA
jgi:hypothetical protein